MWVSTLTGILLLESGSQAVPATLRALKSQPIEEPDELVSLVLVTIRAELSSTSDLEGVS